MSDQPSQSPQGDSSRRAEPPGGAPLDAAMFTLISAAVFLYFGFFRTYSPTADAELVYALSIYTFNWMAKIVGIGLLVVAGLTLARVAFAEWINFGASVLAAIGCLAVGGVWMAYKDGDGLMILLFGMLNAYSARASYAAARRMVI